MTDYVGPSLTRLGDVGPAVREIRERLRLTGDLTEDGADRIDDVSRHAAPDEFDTSVDRAVRAFQQRRGLIADGLIGPQTSAALDGAHWHLGDRLLQFVPGHLMRGDDVAELQERLLTLGFAPQRVDGLFGPDTDRALRGFQRGCGLADHAGLRRPATQRLGRLPAHSARA